MYVLRTTQVKPGGVPDFEQALGEAAGSAKAGSKLAGCWHTEIGPLLQVVELWRVADGGAQADIGPLTARELVQNVEVEVLHPVSFMRPLDGSAQKVGPVFELRIYQIKTGQLQQMIDKWAPMVPGREKLSPLLGCWYSDSGRWFHLWPYPDLATRVSTRARAQQSGVWPPPTTDHLLTQATKIMLPATFSPVQ